MHGGAITPAAFSLCLERCNSGGMKSSQIHTLTEVANRIGNTWCLWVGLQAKRALCPAITQVIPCHSAIIAFFLFLFFFCSCISLSRPSGSLGSRKSKFSVRACAAHWGCVLALDHQKRDSKTVLKPWQCMLIGRLCPQGWHFCLSMNAMESFRGQHAVMAFVHLYNLNLHIQLTFSREGHPSFLLLVGVVYLDVHASLF